MFDMQKVGRRISELRRERNMTQPDLADCLGVSFQAVSNWERGVSMPDISRLPEIARLFGVKVDDLIGEKSEIIESIAEERLDDFLEKGEVSKKELCDAAPILKPTQVEKIFGKINLDCLDDIDEVLPYLPTDVVDKLLRKVVKDEEYDYIEEIATYASSEVITEIAIEMTEMGESVEDFAMHIPQETIDEIARMLADAGDLDELENIAIYVSESVMAEVAVKLTEEGESIEDIAVYLPESAVDSVVRLLAEREDYDEIENIAIYASDEALKDVIRGAIEAGGSISDVKDLFDYIDEDILGDLFRGMLE